MYPKFYNHTEFHVLNHRIYHKYQGCLHAHMSQLNKPYERMVSIYVPQAQGSRNLIFASSSSL